MARSRSQQGAEVALDAPGADRDAGGREVLADGGLDAVEELAQAVAAAFATSCRTSSVQSFAATWRSAVSTHPSGSFQSPGTAFQSTHV